MEDKLIGIIQNNNVDAIFITNKHDITYVSNFNGEDSYVLLTKHNKYIIADKRYIEQAKKQCNDFEAVLFDNNKIDLILKLKSLLKLNNVKNLGVDICDIRHKLYKDILSKVDAEVIDLEEPFKERRSIKSNDEIQKIRRASEIADSSYYRMLKIISEGMSEKDVEIELEYTIKREGGDGYAFAPIIGAGSKSSIPYSWADKNVYLKKGDILFLNYGVKYEGYTAALSRMVSIGNAKDEYKNIYKELFRVYKIVLDSVRPYMNYEELCEIFDFAIKESEYKDYFLQSLGHGRGLQTIEGYTIKPNIKKTILPNQIYSIGIIVSVPDIGGARLEDAVLIKEDSVEILTNSVRNLLNL